MTLPIPHPKIILASRSPRRRELLELIVPADWIKIVPPPSAEEIGFDGLCDWRAIEARIAEIARAKCRDVERILGPGEPDRVIIAADTTIVATARDGTLMVLGQPPEDDTWTDVVTKWFLEYYVGRAHVAMTGLCVATPAGGLIERIVKSEVTFSPEAPRFIPWYLSTGEPRGKAGGYGIQGAGSALISRVTGSISNVVGLPLEALLDIFMELGITR